VCILAKPSVLSSTSLMATTILSSGALSEGGREKKIVKSLQYKMDYTSNLDQ